MTILLFLLCIILFLALIASAAIVPRRSELSPYELERRRSAGDPDVEVDIRREAAYGDIVSLQRVVQAVLLVAFTLTSVAVFGWFLGALIAVIVSLEYSMVASIGYIRRFVAGYYDKYERDILPLIEKNHGVIRWLRSAIPVSERRRIDSRQELEHLVDDSQGVLAVDEKKFILASLKFDGLTVREIMTPKSVVDTIKSTEVLGPLVLDDLHKTGHSRFPVIGEDIDHVVGMLYVRDVLTLDTSRAHSSKAESAMSKKVFYIREDHTLDQALSAFLSTHHHMFIVINEFRETVGIVTLEDVLESLLGRRIIDEFDAHDDMRAVATRNAAKKSAPNRSANSKDV